jgi:hypothetical protein
MNKQGGRLNLSINKETLKHLKVRTDLKGGLAAQLMVCTSCHGTGTCSAACGGDLKLR